MTKLTSISRAAGRDVAYLFAILALSILDFAAWTAGLSVTASLLVLIVGLPAWLVVVSVFRGATGLGRRAAGWHRRSEIPAVYRETAGEGLLARIRIVTADPQTWRDFGWLVINSTVGFVLASAAITVTGLVIGYILTPTYYWALNHPAQQYATLNLGVYTVHTAGWAFVTTGIGLALLPVALWLNHAAAAGHARLAARVLSPTARKGSPASKGSHPSDRPQSIVRPALVERSPA